jgi:enamine deaminase RidA (YjgF/YER057c/UK114 family)
MSSKPSTKALAVRETGTSRIPLAGGVRAGDLVFVSGLLPDELGGAGRPLSGEPAALTQSKAVWRQAAAILAQGDADVSRTIRCDQFFEDWRAVPFFHQVRREVCGSYVAPSTSVLQPQTAVPGTLMMTDMIAVARSGPAIEPIFPQGLDIPATSSFVPVVKSGDFVFVAGFMAASGVGDLDGIAAEAKVPEGHLWKGNRIQLETRYLIRKKLIPALQGAGLTLQDVVKANVFLRDIEDTPAFNQVWNEAFGGHAPATAITPTSKPGFAIEDARIEVNLVATTARHTQRIEGGRGGFTVCRGHPVAIHASDFLIFSGMLAADAEGLIAEARIDPRERYLSSGIEAQMHYLLDCAEEACTKAGAKLSNVVRILQVHTDLGDLLPALKVWQQRLPNVPLPISAARVPAPLIVPGCSVQLDLWIYAPQDA